MTTFGLVAGGGHNAWCWGRVVPELQRRGHGAVAVDLPTSRSELGLADYAEAVVRDMAGVTGDVVLVGHSLAGRYLPLAAGRIPGCRMIFLCALVAEEPPAETSAPPVAADGGERQPPAGGRGRFDEQGRLYFTPDAAAELFYNDCDAETTAWAVSELRPQGSRVLRQAFPAGGWPIGVPAAYILCREDATVTAEAARKLAVERVGVEPVELPGDHSPFLSRPVELVDALERLAGSEDHWAVKRPG